jgi:hypothetical protein
MVCFVPQLVGMENAPPRSRTEHFTEQVPHSHRFALSLSKGELLRYFAWGYLSRRELNERLRLINLQRREFHSAA